MVLNMDQQLFSECLVFIDKIKLVRYLKTFSRHINMFNRLQQKHHGGICSRQNYHVQQARPPSNNYSNSNRDFCLNRNSYNNNINMVDITKKWVVNMSNSPPTEAQTSLLARRPDFEVVPRHSPKREYVAAVEEVCLHLPSKVAAKLRTDTSKHLDKTHPQA